MANQNLPIVANQLLVQRRDPSGAKFSAIHSSYCARWLVFKYEPAGFRVGIHLAVVIRSDCYHDQA